MSIFFLFFANYQLPITHYQLPITNYQLIQLCLIVYLNRYCLEYLPPLAV
ncbi:hypothetical protein BGP_5935 [Beggiatoa sp. PS]|nr:hypothetical protein BGP_5935 [Beggiatoa sp. PS]